MIKSMTTITSSLFVLRAPILVVTTSLLFKSMATLAQEQLLGTGLPQMDTDSLEYVLLESVKRGYWPIYVDEERFLRARTKHFWNI